MADATLDDDRKETAIRLVRTVEASNGIGSSGLLD